MENIVDEDDKKFAALMKEAAPTIKVMFEMLQLRHPSDAPVAVVVTAAMLHVILKVTACPLSPNELVQIVGQHLDFSFYSANQSNETH